MWWGGENFARTIYSGLHKEGGPDYLFWVFRAQSFSAVKLVRFYSNWLLFVGKYGLVRNSWRQQRRLVVHHLSVSTKQCTPSLDESYHEEPRWSCSSSSTHVDFVSLFFFHNEYKCFFGVINFTGLIDWTMKPWNQTCVCRPCWNTDSTHRKANKIHFSCKRVISAILSRPQAKGLACSAPTLFRWWIEMVSARAAS